MGSLIREQMQQRGWGDPQTLFDAGEAAVLAKRGMAYRALLAKSDQWQDPAFVPDFVAEPWFKSMHAVSPEFFDLALHPVLLDAVREILGNNILVWGSSIVSRRPGVSHRWHVDVEHIAWPGVSVFIGLNGVRPHQSSLKFISGSHRFGFAPDHQFGSSDEAILARAKIFDPKCTLDYPAMSDGQFVMFDGPIWHGSYNSAPAIRRAAIIHYSVTGVKVAIPMTWKEPIKWYSHRPPCILASGVDETGSNVLVNRPVPSLSGVGTHRTEPAV